MKRALTCVCLIVTLLVPAVAQAQAPGAGSAGTGSAGAGTTLAEPVSALLRARVLHVVGETEVDVLGEMQTIQAIEFALAGGDRRGEIVIAEVYSAAATRAMHLDEGDGVYLWETRGPGGVRYDVATRDRLAPLAVLAVLFAGIVVLVGRHRGVRSLVALAASFVIILSYVVPEVAAGHAPMRAALIGCGLTMPLTYYMSHGLNRKTSIALAGSLVGLVITGMLSSAAIGITGLTGFSGDEASFVAGVFEGAIDLRGLLLAGMMISVLGVLDDISVAQAATVEQIHAANRALDRWQLYRRGMQVGQDHISSMVNTLMLVYAGAALALLLLVTNQALPLGYVLSQELVAEEIVRMLVSSIGLVATVPVTTLMAAHLIAARNPEGGGQADAAFAAPAAPQNGKEAA